MNTNMLQNQLSTYPESPELIMYLDRFKFKRSSLQNGSGGLWEEHETKCLYVLQNQSAKIGCNVEIKAFLQIRISVLVQKWSLWISKELLYTNLSYYTFTYILGIYKIIGVTLRSLFHVHSMYRLARTKHAETPTDFLYKMAALIFLQMYKADLN